MAILYLIVGIALLWFGGDLLIRGSVALAQRFGVSTLLIGLTVVAFGTSAPELAVNVMAALEGRGDLSFGNIVGSNIANIALILAIGAMIRPVAVHPSVIKRDIPFMLLASAALAVMCNDDLLEGSQQNLIARSDGAVLLLIFAMYMLFTIRAAIRESRQGDPMLLETEQEVAAIRPARLWLACLMTLGGLGAVVAGGDVTVEGATQIARWAGLSEAVIGLTIVAVGTSLPELVTTISAVRAGHTDIAVGNIVGSNIWNILLILASTAMIRPLGVPEGGDADLWMMIAVAAAMLPLSMRGERKIGRWPGLALLVSYAAFVAYRVV